MAMKPLRPCRKPGCCTLVLGGYCAVHRPKDQRSQASADWHRLYLLPLWTEELRPGQLLREPFCRECAKRGIREPATDVDHIRPHEGNMVRFKDPRNLQSLCHSCHSRKTMTEQREKWRKVKRV